MAEEKKIKFTDEQLAVIRARKCDLLVSAAAGSGKTAVLAERIASLVSDGDEPCDIDRVLVVTFTRAAASQMRERIGRALAERIALDPTNRRLRRQEMMLPHAKIMTIDAFCQYILRNSFEAAGIDPAFKVADEAAMKLIMKEAMGEILEEAYKEGRPEFLRLADSLCAGASDSALEEQIEKLYRFAESMPWPALWLKTRIAESNSGNGLLSQNWITSVTERITKELSCARQELEAVLNIARSPGGPWMYEEALEAEINRLRELEGHASFEELHAALYGGGGDIFNRLSAKKDADVLLKKREAAKEARGRVKKLITGLVERYFSAPLNELKEREEAAGESLKELASLALSLRERLEEKKREENIIDFSDMEHLALKVLAEEPESLDGSLRPSPTQTAGEYAEFFKEIMVDEYQDSNFVQEIILGAISGGSGVRDRFMVGDVKQSIYRFRLARPEIFMEKLGSYSKAEGACERRIDLHRNFRSRREVLDIVNAVFSRIMLADVGGVDYDEDAALRAGAEYPEAGGERIFVNDKLAFIKEDYTPELLLCQYGGDEDGAGNREASGNKITEDTISNDIISDDIQSDVDIPAEELTKEQAEASMIAERIKRLVRYGRVSDGAGGLRRAGYGDIVILLRTTAGVDEVYRDVLGAAGIPVYIESKSGYFKTQEIRLILDMLRVLENPLRDIPLAAVMRSRAFGGFTDEELAEIRTADGGAGLKGGLCLYESLLGCAGGEGTLSVKCAGFINRLKGWREAAGRLTIRDLLDEIMDETNYIGLMSVMSGGRRRRANIRMLLKRAEDASESGRMGLSDFIARMEQYRRVDVDFGEANVLSEDADVVRIMSIHRSKGLEFPIVFVSGLSRSFNRGDERAAVLADERAGLGTWAVDVKNRVRYSTLKRLAVADSIREESLGEEIRVLYVAMTRAKEKLILTACVKGDKALGAAASAEPDTVSAENDRTSIGAVSYIRRAHASNCLELIEAALELGPAPIRIKLCRADRVGGLNGDKADDGGAERYKALMEAVEGRYKNNSYYINMIKENLHEKYGHSELSHLIVKTTVTEMKEKMLEEEGDKNFTNRLIRSTDDAEIVPKFIKNEEKLVGRTRGTAYHKVMEILDSEILGLDGISNQDLTNKNRNIVYKWLKKREKSGELPEGCAASVDPKDILKFLSSPLGIRMTEAFSEGRLFRERQFMAEIDAKRVDVNAPEGETVLLQGVVDAYFIDGDGRIVIVDYKTDRLKQGSDGSELVEKYRLQLELYAEILERLTHRSVAQKWIYSFAIGSEIEVP